MNLPKVSVIIPIYNDDLKMIRQTIGSVREQDYKNLEIVVVNGGKKLNLKGVKEIQSVPKGIANAFNVGVKASSGEFLYFMGAGDTLVDKNVVGKMMVGIGREKDWLVVGNINRIDKLGKIIYRTKIKFRKWQLLYKMPLPHQGLFMSKKYFEKYGLFDESCMYAMDYELLLRAYQDFPAVKIKDVVVANWCEGGVGQDRTDRVIEEYHLIRCKNKVAPRWFLNFINTLINWRYGFKKN